MTRLVRRSIGIVALLLTASACVPQPPLPPGPPTLYPVAVNTELPGAFAAPRAVWADSRNVYLAGQSVGSYGGGLLVLRRDAATGFPVIQTVKVRGAFPFAVRGDERWVYTGWSDGLVRVYDRGGSGIRLARTLVLRTAVPVTDFAIVGDLLVVGQGGTNLAANARLIGVAGPDRENLATLISLRDWSALPWLGPFDAGKTTFFATESRVRVGAIAYPTDIHGVPTTPGLSADSAGFAFNLGAGCCSSGLQLMTNELELSAIQHEAGANTAILDGAAVTVGYETGQDSSGVTSTIPSCSPRAAG